MQILSLILAAQLLTSAPGEATARDIFRDQVRPTGEATPEFTEETGLVTVHGLNIQMLRVNEPAGTTESVNPECTHKTGSAFRIRVETFTNLYIYVLNVNSTGKLAVLFPGPGERHLEVRPDLAVVLPPASDVFRFAKGPGVENFYVIASPKSLNWANPNKFIPGGKNARAVEKAVKQTKKRAVKVKSVKDLMDRLRKDKGSRSKDLDLLPPPADGGQDAIHGSSDPNDDSHFLVPIVPKHCP